MLFFFEDIHPFDDGYPAECAFEDMFDGDWKLDDWLFSILHDEVFSLNFHIDIALIGHNDLIVWAEVSPCLSRAV